MTDAISYNLARVITTSDTVNLPGGPPGAVFVGGGGTVTAVWADGTTTSFTAPVGVTLPIRPVRINATGTAATLLVALYQV